MRSGMTAVVMMVAAAAQIKGGNWVEEFGSGGGGWGGGVSLEWKNTISPALLQCLSSQLVTLKHKS